MSDDKLFIDGYFTNRIRQQRLDEALARVAELEAVLRECGETLDNYVKFGIMGRGYNSDHARTLAVKITATLGAASIIEKGETR